ncbi:hypothetical protein LSH36_469g00030 [Paralvinella palmiformis]|uniref:Uncharacterized protein n=1 Tax=Paralvinella palmiformis TaxID=53620 RepID=A0AAD9JAM8_9ANNE|nr:hypothetical protein LSH36_469g00030 [Paralvinella palmiformis]
MSRARFFRTRTMWSPIGVLWTLLSTIVAALSAFSFLQPYWFINRKTYNSLGMFSYCIRDMRTKGDFAHVCGIYGGRFNFSNLPSNAWQVACVLFGGGSFLLCLAACLGLITVCLPRSWDKRLSAATGYVQITAGKSRIGRSRAVDRAPENVWR